VFLFVTFLGPPPIHRLRIVKTGVGGLVSIGIVFEVVPDGLAEDEVSPVEWTYDGKDLADLVAWLAWEDWIVPRLVLPAAVNALLWDIRKTLSVDDEFEALSALRIEPQLLRYSSQVLSAALQRIEGDPILSQNFPEPGTRLRTKELRERVARFQGVLSDIVRVCDWAQTHERRVHFIAY